MSQSDTNTSAPAALTVIDARAELVLASPLDARAANVNRFQSCLEASALQLGCWAVLMGFELIAVKQELGQTRGRKKNSSTPQTNFDGWLEMHCPKVKRAAAYKYIALAEGCKINAIKNEPASVLALMDCAPSALPQESFEKLKKDLNNFANGRTLAAIAAEVGVLKAPKANTRNHEPAGPQLSKEEIAYQEAQIRFLHLQRALYEINNGHKEKLLLLPASTDKPADVAALRVLKELHDQFGDLLDAALARVAKGGGAQ